MELVRKDPDTTVLSDPTQMSDELATKLGLKVYSHGTTYNGGNAPTITSPQGGFVVYNGNFIPYMLQDGTWRLKIDIMAAFTGTSLSQTTVTINGIASKVLSAGSQSLAGFMSSPVLGVPVSTAHRGTYITSNTNTITLITAASTTTNGVVVSGDIELASKPTWAY